jgi:hypothetical protein
LQHNPYIFSIETGADLKEVGDMPTLSAEMLLSMDLEDVKLKIGGKLEPFPNPLTETQVKDIGAGYFAPKDVLEKLLPSPTITLPEPVPGMCVVSMHLIEYPPTDTNPELRHQFAMAASCNFKAKDVKESINGGFVMLLGIEDNQATIDREKALGFSYEFGEITVEETEDEISGIVKKDGKLIIEFNEKKKPLEDQALDSIFFNIMNQKIVPIVDSMKGQGSLVIGQEAECTFKLGNHPLAKKIAAMKLKPEPIMGFQVMDGITELHVTNKSYAR